MKHIPANTFGKYDKYITTNTYKEFDVDKKVSQVIENTEKFKLRGVQLTLLADHLFYEEHGNISAGFMYTGINVPYHNHDYYEINYVVSGKCVEYIGNRAFVLEEGDFLFMPLSVFHTPAPVGDSRCVDILFRNKWMSEFEKKIITFERDNYISKLLKQNSYLVFKGKNKAASSTANHIIEYFSNKKCYLHYHELYAESLAEKLLLELEECPVSEIFYTNTKPYETAELYTAILQYINDNLTTVTLESVADFFGYTSYHLSRIIKKHTGNGFATYLMLQRILRAEEYLLKTDIPIGKIPSLIGLDSPEYFSRVFKKYNYVTPSEYRKIKKQGNS